MNRIVFGSKEANAQLEYDTGRRFDLRDVDPLGYHPPTKYDVDAPEPTCPICGHHMDWVDCWQCGGKGGRDGDDLTEEDPMWYDEDDWEDCDICRGAGGYFECINVPHNEPNKEE